MSQTLITDEQLLSFNNQGLIPGPEESEASFIKRATYCLNLRQEFADLFEEPEPFEQEEALAVAVLQEAEALAMRHFQIAPKWVPLFFSNRRLPFWQGGCAWIFQKDDAHPTASFLQLRLPLKTHICFWGIYRRDELVAHELAHVGRMTFEEPCFEEFFAYQTSSSSLRRFLGPLVRSAKESAIFLFILMTLVIADFYLLWAGAGLAMFKLFFWLHLIPVALIGYTLVRLIFVHMSFRRAQTVLREAGISDQGSAAILYRMTDQEIKTLSRQEWELGLQEKSKSSLRWRLIRLMVQAL